MLLGCDYCDSIRGIGPKTGKVSMLFKSFNAMSMFFFALYFLPALKLIREHKSIETILANVDRKKHGVPYDWVPKESKLKDGEENKDGHFKIRFNFSELIQ